MDEIKQAIRRLFMAWPLTAQDGKESMKLYAEVLKEFKPGTVSRCIDTFIGGKVGRHDGRFRPPAPLIAKEIRENWEYNTRSKWDGVTSNWIEDHYDGQRQSAIGSHVSKILLDGRGQ